MDVLAEELDERIEVLAGIERIRPLPWSNPGRTRSAVMLGRARTQFALGSVVAVAEGDGGHTPMDDEPRGLGVDPWPGRSQDDELPDVLQ